MKTIKNLRYSPEDERCLLDVYLPENDKFETIIYFHGGGYQGGSKDDKSYVEMAESFQQKGICFVNCNYRMYPNAKFPDYLIDGAKAVRYIRDAFNIHHPLISGQSAGAHLSMMLCFDRHYLLDEGVNPDDIKGWIIESGQATSHFNLLEIEKGIDQLAQRIDELAPLYYVDKNVNFSKMIIIIYENDMPNRKEQNLLLISACKNYNPNLDISYILLPGTHCHGSCFKDEDGEYPYVKESIKWMKERGLY